MEGSALATIIICDRCGDQTEKRDELYGICGPVKHIPTASGGRWEIRDLDLCDECRRSFVDWMNTRPAETVDK